MRRRRPASSTSADVYFGRLVDRQLPATAPAATPLWPPAPARAAELVIRAGPRITTQTPVRRVA
ncbi:hypothetical protein [Micromonospora sp. NPDC049645]|uniref:hypothetical protein n=1 Tax=Micromonospora sp. NPDC049645 TaxID=3155508 RepID=UPI0034484504